MVPRPGFSSYLFQRHYFEQFQLTMIQTIIFILAIALTQSDFVYHKNIIYHKSYHHMYHLVLSMCWYWLIVAIWWHRTNKANKQIVAERQNCLEFTDNLQSCMKHSPLCLYRQRAFVFHLHNSITVYHRKHSNHISPTVITLCLLEYKRPMTYIAK